MKNELKLFSLSFFLSFFPSSFLSLSSEKREFTDKCVRNKDTNNKKEKNGLHNKNDPIPNNKEKNAKKPGRGKKHNTHEQQRMNGKGNNFELERRDFFLFHRIIFNFYKSPPRAKLALITIC